MEQTREQIRAELYKNRLRQQTVPLMDAILAFMNVTLMDIIPADRFADIFNAGCLLQPNHTAIIDLRRVNQALEEYNLNADQPSSAYHIPDSEEVAGPGLPVPADLRQRLLNCLDMQAFFKMFVFLPTERTGDSLYSLAVRRCPDLSRKTEKQFQDMCRRALSLRNNFAHVSSGASVPDTPRAWKEQSALWVQIARLLCNDANRAGYENLHRVWEEGGRIAFSSVEEIAYSLQMPLTPQQVAQRLRDKSGYRVTKEGFVEAGLDEAVSYLSRQISKEQEKEKNEAELAELRQQIAQTDQQQDIRLRVVRRNLGTVQPLSLLNQYTGGAIDQRTLLELAQTHRVILTPSVLRSDGGKYFLSNRLTPAMEGAGRPMYIERTAMLRLVRDIDRLAEHRLKYPNLDSLGPERDAVVQERDRLEQAKGTYVVAMDQLKVHLIGVADPMYTDDEALIRTLLDHPFERCCIFVSGATRLPALIDRSKLPFVTLARVSGNELTEVTCMVFHQFLPFARPDIHDPLLQPLIQASYAQTERLMKTMGQTPDSTAPAAALPAVPAAPAVPAVPAVPETSPAPAVPAIPAASAAPQSHAAAPAPAAPAPRTVPHSGLRRAKASFAPNLPLRTMDETPLPFPGKPKKGLVLYTEEGEAVTLGDPLTEEGEPAEGGEGILFLTDTEGTVAKLYNQEHLTAGRRDKLAEMLTHDPGIPGVCWPTHLLSTGEGVFCGYTMPRAPKDALPFSKSVLKIGSPSQRQALMAHWTRRDLIRIARAAAQIMQQLHRNNILMGDVNGGNFMVDLKDSSRVYVVDTDSFQLGGFPCPVGIEKFTHPGIRQRLHLQGPLDFKTILRTENEEDYSFSILVFEILFLGQNPFATKTDLDFTQAMAQKRFAYGEADRREGDFEVPDGDNWMIWKNLPRKVTTAFSDTFLDWKSTTAAQWVSLMNDYLYQVEKRGFSDELAPAKYHEFSPDDPVFVDLVCPFCHREFNMHKNRVAQLRKFKRPILCRNCQNSLEIHRNESCRVTCADCHKTFETTVENAVLCQCEKGRILCQDCRYRQITCSGCSHVFLMDADRLEEKKARHITRFYCPDCLRTEPATCSNCGKSFRIQRGKRLWLEHHHNSRYPLRLYCPECQSEIFSDRNGRRT